MSNITCKIWIITAPWYDARGFYAWDGSSKRRAIKQAVDSFGKPWAALRRDGWRAVQAVVTWPR